MATGYLLKASLRPGFRVYQVRFCRRLEALFRHFCEEFEGVSGGLSHFGNFRRLFKRLSEISSSFSGLLKGFWKVIEIFDAFWGAKGTVCGFRRPASLEVVRGFDNFGTFGSVFSRFGGLYRVLKVFIAFWRFLSRFGSF